MFRATFCFNNPYVIWPVLVFIIAPLGEPPQAATFGVLFKDNKLSISLLFYYHYHHGGGEFSFSASGTQMSWAISDITHILMWNFHYLQTNNWLGIRLPEEKSSLLCFPGSQNSLLKIIAPHSIEEKWELLNAKYLWIILFYINCLRNATLVKLWVEAGIIIHAI